MLHRTRHLFIRQQTSVINAIRAHLAEFGIHRKMTITTAGTITGGTGEFYGIQGLLRLSISADLQAGTSESQVELEYWISR